MHSLKHTFISIVLLGVSFALYQFSLTPVDPATKDMASNKSSPEPTESSLLDTQTPVVNPHSANSGAASGTLATVEPSPPTSISPPSLSAAPAATPAAKPQNKLAEPSLEIPQLPEMPSQFTAAPPQPPAPVNKPSQPSNSTRQPVESTIVNGVQKIKYPDMPATNAKPSNAMDLKTMQRQTTQAALEDGLIDALNEQKTANDGRDFIATVPKSTPLATNTTPSASPAFRPVSSFAASSESKDAKPKVIAKNSDSPANATVSAIKPDTRQTPAVAKPVSAEMATQPISTAAPARSVISDAELQKLTYKTAWAKVDERVANEDFYSALKILSRFYRDDTLNGPQRQRLLGWLDSLAGKVIFSAEDHLTGKAYTVQPQDTLANIAKRWQVPTQLIANIQGPQYANREVVPAGTKLKEIPGPFHAELKLSARVITLFLGDLYAGRFPVVIGTSGEPVPGEFQIVLKSETGYNWYDENGREYPPDSPQNGYGPYWIGLTGKLCIHAVADNTREGHDGCIGLTQKDAADLFSILSETSRLTIVK